MGMDKMHNAFPLTPIGSRVIYNNLYCSEISYTKRLLIVELLSYTPQSSGEIVNFKF